MGLRTRKRSTKGGKYVGEGTYGCGYSPAIRCKGQATRPAGMFSKVMNKNDAEEEAEISAWFKRVDPRQQYFIYPTKKCVVHKEELDPVENNLKPCKKGKYTTKAIKNARMLQFVNGGQSLSSLTLGPDDYSPFFQSITQLLEGLKILHSYNIAHMDIKGDNIVILKNTATSFHIRYIDFGLSINLEELLTKPIDDRIYRDNYFAWPYDTRFMTNNFMKTKITEDSVEDFIDDHQISNYPFPFELYYDNTNTLQVSKNTYTQIWDTITASLGGDKNVWKQHISKSTDVYSLGRVISKLYTKYTGHFYRYGQVFVWDEKRKTKPSLESLQGVLAPEVWEWHKAVSEQITEPLNHLILNMMDINPIDRISAADALTEYKGLLQKFQTLFTPTLITKALDLTSGGRAGPRYGAVPVVSATTTRLASVGPVSTTAANTNTGLGALGAGAGPIGPAPIIIPPPAPPIRVIAAPAAPRINQDPFPMEKLVRLRALEKKQNRGEELTNDEEAEVEIAKLLINAWEEVYSTSGGKRRTRRVRRRRR